MNRIASNWIVLALLLPAGAFAQIACTRAASKPRPISILRRKARAIFPECRWRKGLPTWRTCKSSISKPA